MFESWSATKNIVERALSTFIQTFAGSFGATLILTQINDWLAFKTAALSSLGAALLSVRKNLTAEAVKAKAVEELTTTAVREARITER